MSAVTIDQAMALAMEHHQAGRLAEAESIYRQILTASPQHADALHLLGVIAHQTGQNNIAVELIGNAIQLNPNSSAYYSNLGEAYRVTGQLDQAIAAFRTAIELKPDLAEAHYNLGNALADQGQLDQAIAAYRIAIQLQADYAKAHCNLGIALKAQGQLDQAIAAYHTAIQLKPDFAEAHYNLGNALGDQGQLDAAIAACRAAIQLDPNDAEAHSNLVFTTVYHPGYDAAAVAEEARRWNEQHAHPLAHLIQPHHNDRTPDRRLRVGYVSPDFRAHPVARFLLPLLSAHDHQHFEIFAYSQVPHPDAFTQRLQSHTDYWRSIVGRSDEHAADLIRQDRIDILVDLAGHTAHNRLPLFARKPAPVQVTYLGYPATTGVETIDYRLTDVHADPPEQAELAQLYHSEQLVRLSPTAWCFQIPEDSPPEVRDNGPLTFGCFNNFAKVSESMLRLWCKIARQVPQSRLLLKSNGLGSESVRRRVRQLLGEEGIGPERMELLGPTRSHADHIALYRRMDIALDTFPYHGTTTTCEALWMGVPVVTLAGPSHVSRVGVSLLNNVDLAELVAHSEGEYIEIVRNLATDVPRLAELRATLRSRMKASPLMDAPRLARNIEAEYRQMWRTWCARA